MTVQAQTSDKTISQSLDILQLLLADYHPRDFSVRFWDGSQWPAETPAPRFTLSLKHPGALRRMLQDIGSDLSAGEAYIFDDFDIEGSLEAVFPVLDYLLNQNWNNTITLRLGWLLRSLPNKSQPRPAGRQAAQLSGKPHSIERDRQAIAYHYDVSNDFYALWLDRRMVYSSAYFNTPEDTLDTAQECKLDYLCRKLRLQPGERLLDLGCGWGGLVMHAAQHYQVDALGITLSQPQAELANRRIQEAGLSDRCRVEVRDYRELNEAESFDKLVSVGMFEHVGETLLPAYFRQAWNLLRPGGVFLNHGIARAVVSPPMGSRFILTYVFPDGELVPIHVTLRHAEETGFEMRDVEGLREHYALTLRQWVKRLEARHKEILQVVDETTYRVWRLFMSASIYFFMVGWTNLYQTLLVKPDQGRSGLPLSRADWYQNRG
jgi:cyclopropane-fatty-acyl-phospholipid synthase